MCHVQTISPLEDEDLLSAKVGGGGGQKEHGRDVR